MIHTIIHYIIYYLNKIFRFNSFKKINSFKSLSAKKNEYSMSGFERLKCIFVHIPKNAGISICHSLFGNLGSGHRKILFYLLAYHPSTFNSYYKFCFIRNPWDRVVSAYFFLRKGGINKFDRDFCENHLSDCKSFDDFVLNYLKKRVILNHMHFIHQHKFIFFMGKSMVDKIYKFEEIETSIESISKIFKISIDKFPKINANKSRKNYKQYYNKETQEIVANIYKSDIEIFNYNF